MKRLMSDDYKVVATPTFNITLKKLNSFLSRKFGDELAATTRGEIKQCVASLAKNPFAAPVSERLADLGFTDYRQMLVDKHNLVYYRVDEQARKVVLVIAMDSRQSIEQLLYQVMITAD